MKKTYDFSKGRRGAVVASDRRKVRITIRLDKDVIDWYRKKDINQKIVSNLHKVVKRFR